MTLKEHGYHCVRSLKMWWPRFQTNVLRPSSGQNSPRNSTRQTAKGDVTDNAYRNIMKGRVTSVVPAGRQGEMWIDSRYVYKLVPLSWPIPPLGFPCPIHRRDPFVLVSIPPPHIFSLFGLRINVGLHVLCATCVVCRSVRCCCG